MPVSLALAATLASVPSSLRAGEPTQPAATGNRWQRLDREPIDPPVHRQDRGAKQSRVAPISPEQAAAFQQALWDAHALADAYGVTFAAVHDGTLLWAGASGVERDGLTQLAADRPQVIGSVTKTFVAALILQLIDEGRLSLDEPAAQLLPEAIAAVGAATVRQLLDHTSGMADVYFTEALRAALDETPDRVLGHFEVLATLPGPWFVAGDTSTYSNANYLVLALIAERALHRPLAQTLEARFAKPLGLATTRTLDPLGADEPMPPAWRSIFWGSGAMASSAADLARWGDALYGGALLTPGTRQQMLTFNDHGHGLGVQQLSFGELSGYGHVGLLNTFTSLLVYLPDADVTLAVLVNRSEVDAYSMLTHAVDGRPSLLDVVLSAAAP
ncbi:MAG: serine hydrolase domain-containing protein [Candidatus Limnocylindria bacterium]